MTVKEALIQELSHSDRPLAIHEIGLMGVSQTSMSARLREMARAGIVVSVPVPGRKYTAWAIKPGQGDLL